MYKLALETAFGKFSLALFGDGKLLDSYFCEKENEQAELLIPAIEELLARNGIKYSALASIAVGTGPGSFTGVRIGLAAAKGLTLATGAELIGISSLQASAYKQGGGKVYLNAQRGQAYFQEFDTGIKALGEAELVTYNGLYSPLPDAISIGYLNSEVIGASPLYIRKPDAKFRLREAAEKDIGWMTAVQAECFANKWNEKMIADSLKNGKAIIADRLGFIIYEIIGDECEIKTIATLPNARRKGVASFMWWQVLKNCQAQNVKKVFLEVEADDSGAVKFYEKLGLRIFSQRKNYYGPNRDALLMQLAISAQ